MTKIIKGWPTCPINKCNQNWIKHHLHWARVWARGKITCSRLSDINISYIFGTRRAEHEAEHYLYSSKNCTAGGAQSPELLQYLRAWNSLVENVPDCWRGEARGSFDVPNSKILCYLLGPECRRICKGPSRWFVQLIATLDFYVVQWLGWSSNICSGWPEDLVRVKHHS